MKKYIGSVIFFEKVGGYWKKVSDRLAEEEYITIEDIMVFFKREYYGIVDSVDEVKIKMKNKMLLLSIPLEEGGYEKVEFYEGIKDLIVGDRRLLFVKE